MKNRLLPILVSWLLLSPVLFAQILFTPLQIEAALKDQLFDLAEQQIWNALSIQQTPEQQTDLTLLLVRALTGQQKFEEAIILAEESAPLLQPDAFLYWKARALFEAGNLDQVALSLEPLPKSSPFYPASLRLKGRSSWKASHLKEAQKLFETFQKQFPHDEQASQNLLDLGKIYLERDKKKSSSKTFYLLLETSPDTAPADSARLLLARNLMTSGGKKEQIEARVQLETLGSTPSAHPRLRITAWAELATLEKKQNYSAAAAEALLNAEKLTDETLLRIRQKTARANLLLTEGETQQAFDLFDEAIAAAPTEDLAADVLIQKAEALLADSQFAKAEIAFQACLNIATHPPLLAQASSGKGWSLWGQKHYEEAAHAFEQATSQYEDSSDKILSLIKAGDSRLAANQFNRAKENYALVIQTEANHPLAAHATYQIGISEERAGKSTEALQTFQTAETNFPKSDFAPRAALQRTALMKREKQWEPALEEYIRIANTYTNAATRAVALHQQGVIQLELHRYTEAQQSFFAVSQTYPNSPEAPQAFYMLGFSKYLRGDLSGAMELFNSFIEKYPQSPWVPEVLFRIGKHAYNTGDYPQAQKTFLDMVSRFPENSLADDALFWTGNALLQQDRFLEAFSIYSQLAKDYPNSDRLLTTRFAQGETLTELGEFSRAILAYEEVIKTDSDHSLSNRARGRIGDCLFTLGSTAPGRYKEALDVYQALYKYPSIPFSLKVQVLYKMARCEEKMGHPDKAFAHYMKGVYSVDELSGPLSPDAILWFTRAAFEAAAQQEREQNWQTAIHLYERIIEAGVPAQDEAGKRIEKIKQDGNAE